MKEQKLYTIYDHKADMYLPPVIFKNDEMACRSIALQIAGDKSMISQFPSDYSIVEIGDWNCDNALISSSGPRVVMTITQALSKIAIIKEEYANYFKNIYEQYAKEKKEDEKVSE